jgi:hypothetical protein
MRRALFLLFAIVPALPALLAGCAGGGVRWQKPGAVEADVARDLSACRKETAARYGAPGASGLYSPTDPRFGPLTPSPAEAQMQQAEAVGRCMRGKGYDLVRTEQPS